ncbi:MAG: nucleotidyltransferase domain-containing protein [Chthoniobacterales bacterium]
MKDLPKGLLEEAVQKLAAEFAPEAIYLFGSHAWGNPTNDSDVDFFVIVSDSSEKPVQRAQRAHGVLSNLPAPKDVVVFTRAEVDRVKHLRASLSHQILRYGQKLYG